MREELTRLGVKETRTPEDLESVIRETPGTVMVVVNSVCGCAARNARPAVAMAMSHAVKPDVSTTVFAGQDLEATERARDYFVGYPPSSPSIALLKDGDLVFMLPRHRIEGRTATEIAADLTSAFDQFCTPASAAASA